jgi:hypothetical protein
VKATIKHVQKEIDFPYASKQVRLRLKRGKNSVKQLLYFLCSKQVESEGVLSMCSPPGGYSAWVKA